MRKLLWHLQTFAVIGGSFILALLPLAAGDVLGRLVGRLWKARWKIALENVRLSSLAGRDDAESLVRRSFENLGRSWLEVLKVYYGIGRGRILGGVTVSGSEHVRKAQEEGKGIIMVTGHCGSWELLAIAFSLQVARSSIVARPLDNPYLNARLERIREHFGNRVINKRGAVRGMLSVLRSGGVVGLLMDQAVVPGEGFVIDFLGRGAWTTKMPALMARKTGAVLIPAFIRRTAKGHEIHIEGPVPLSANADGEEALREDTVKLSGYIERYVRENPTEWLWIHRRWKRVDQGETPGKGTVGAAA